jgi:Uma2 family endonuclease
MPELAIEVQSKGQSKAFLRDKGSYYLVNGSQVVWIFYPEQQIVDVMTPDDQIVQVGRNGTLTAENVVPGLTIPLNRIFENTKHS